MKANNLLEVHQEESYTNNTWVMMFADLLSLLLVFFILIYSMSSIKGKKWDDILDSLEERFQVDKLIPDTSSVSKLGVEKTNEEFGVNLGYIYSIFDDAIKNNALLSEKVELNIEHDHLNIILPNDLLFSGNTPIVTDDAQLVLLLLSKRLESLRNRVEVIGSYEQNPNLTSLTGWKPGLEQAAVIAIIIRDYGYVSNIQAMVQPFYVGKTRIVIYDSKPENK